MIKAEETQGYKELTQEQAEMFKEFTKNFFNAWGTEARDTIQPISIEAIEKEERAYLKFIYEMYGRKEWLHVLDPHTWY